MSPRPTDEPGPAPLPPWGTHPLSGPARTLTRMARAVPGWPGVRQAAFLFRRMARSLLDGPVDHELWGHRLRFLPRGNISEGRLLFMPDRWDRRERAVIREHAGPGTVLVDVGCNFGAYTWWLLHLLGHDCTILALEPEPALHERLRFNLATNGWDNVTPVPVAAGAQAGTATLWLHGDNRGQNTLAAPDAGHAAEAGGGTVQVPVRPLAEVVAQAGLTRIDILKIDIEGLEPPVLQAFFHAAPEALWPRLLLSERQDAPDYDSLESFLADRGYGVILRTDLNMVLRRTPAPPSSRTADPTPQER